jgi:hypothetical protein
MYPDQNQNQPPIQPPSQPGQQPQYSIDYLNQIAPPAKKPGMNNRIFIFLAGGGLLLAVIIGFFSLINSGTGPTEKMQTLAARIEALHTISDKSQKNIQSGDLRSTNSNLTVFLTNAYRDIAEPLSNNNVDIKSIDKEIASTEETSAEELTQKLEDARLNAVFDRVYAREMAYQLDKVAALMKDIYGSVKSKSLKDFLVSTDTNLQPLKKQFYDFSTESNE